MRTTLLALVLCAGLLTSAFAGNNPKPLGLEVGVATYDEARKALSTQTELRATGPSAVTGGPILEGKGEGLGVDGLTSLVLVFDARNVLVAVEMDFSKSARVGNSVGSFAEMTSRLQGKYRMVSKTEPFVGDASARFDAGDSIVTLVAPHMSFVMRLTYMTKVFQGMWAIQRQREAAEGRKQQASKL